MKTNAPHPAAPQDVVVGRRRGAPPGNRNALKTGAHVKEVRTLRKQITSARRTMKLLIACAKEELAGRRMNGREIHAEPRRTRRSEIAPRLRVSA